MKCLSLWTVFALFILLALVLLSPGTLRAGDEPPPLGAQVPQAPAAPDFQLLTNPGVEVYDPPYDHYEGIACQVASGWQRFWDEEQPEPCWMDCRVFAASHLGGGWVDRIEGDTSQLIVSTEPYTAGIRQTVTGLTPGAGYGFHAAMLTIFQTSAPPDVDDTMFKQVGLDPTGGTDPNAPTVVWSEADGHDANGWSIDLRAAAFAQAPTMTVFVRVISPYPSGGLPYINLSFLDSAILALTPVVSATSSAVSEATAFTVNWDNLVTAPGLKRFKGYDVQWLDEVEGVWHGWLTGTMEVAATFAGEQGHAYRFRARAWQKYLNGALLVSPYRPEGDSRTLVAGPRLVGQVLSTEGLPVIGATVAISGTDLAATSGAGGYYELLAQPSPEARSVTVGHPRWLAPPPVHGIVFGPTDTVTLTWTLRPLSDALVNGDFEAGLDGWSLANARTVSDTVHSGRLALALGGGEALSGTVAASQTVVLTDAWEPHLSFWYRAADATETDDSLFNVALTVVTETISTTWTVSPTASAGRLLTGPVTVPVTVTVPITTTYLFTPSLEAGDWQHQAYRFGPTEAGLTATVRLEFIVRRGEEAEEARTIYLDEVGLGATPGGPHRTYLPLVLRRF